MSETPFFKTRMGQRYYERTMPELVTQLEQLNNRLELLGFRVQLGDPPYAATTNSPNFIPARPMSLIQMTYTRFMRAVRSRPTWASWTMDWSGC